MKLQDEKWLKDFHQALLARGLSPKSAEQHRENLRFFVESFLEPSEGMELNEVDAETVEYFFIHWYPSRVNGSRTELSGFIPSFRKFFPFLQERGALSRETCEEILGILSRREYLLQKFNPKTRTEELIEGPNRYGNGSPELASPFWIDRGLYFLVRNLTQPKIRILLDFQLFLDYLSHHPVRLLPSSASLPHKHLHKLNQMFSEPEDLPQKASQDCSRRLNLFYHLARNLDLFLIGHSFKLLLTPRAKLFLEMNSDQQLVVLLDALWNRVRWSELQRFGSNGFASWAQEQRGGFAELLSRLPANTPWLIAGANPQDRLTQMLANYLRMYEVVENLIMFGLKEMGILDYKLGPKQDPYFLRNHLGISAIILTNFGKKVMRYLARRAREEMGVESLMDLMEEGLIYL